MHVSVGVIIAFFFCGLLVVTALVVALLLMRNLFQKQKIYSNFASYLSDFLVIVSMDGRLIDATPTYITFSLYGLWFSSTRILVLDSCISYPSKIYITCIFFLFSFGGEFCGTGLIEGASLWTNSALHVLPLSLLKDFGWKKALIA